MGVDVVEMWEVLMMCCVECGCGKQMQAYGLSSS